MQSLVAVGMPLTRHPPHRSVRAVLPQLEQALNSGVPPPITPEFPGIQPSGFQLVFHAFPQLAVNRLAPTLLFGVNGGQAAGKEGARVLVCRKLVAHHPGGAKHGAQLAGAEGWVVLLNTLERKSVVE